MKILDILKQAIVSFFVLFNQVIFGQLPKQIPIINENIATTSAKIATNSAEPEKVITYIQETVPEEILPKGEITNGKEKYLMENHPSGEEGFYVLKNAPSEPMSTVEELNNAVISYRKTHGFGELFIDPQMCDIAHQRAIEANQEFSHNKFSEHVKAGDYNYTGFNTIQKICGMVVSQVYIL